MGALPLVMASVRSASLIFCTSSDAKSFAFLDFPVGVWPLPSAPWHIAHFDLYVASAAAVSAFAGAPSTEIAATSAPAAISATASLLRFRMFFSLVESQRAVRRASAHCRPYHSAD